jgi:hypothetical protein
MLKEPSFAINGYTLQIRREGNNVKVIFSGRGLECLRVAMGHDLYKSLGDVDMCRKFDIFEIQAPIIFFGIPVFSARRDGR